MCARTRMFAGLSATLTAVRLLIVITLLLTASVAEAQDASIAGVVRDTSGAVLPGVTVEASSPSLIEKARSVVTDGTGQYRIISLPPGTYTLTFSLQGFNTVRRQGIALSGSFTATINMDLAVATLAETITVTGESPIVDTQNTARQTVFNHEVIDTIPAGRNVYSLAVLIPSVQLAGAFGSGQDVGGSGSGVNATPNLTAHGSRGGAQKTLQNGVQNTAMGGAGYDTPFPYNPAATQEVVLDTAAISPELGVGGVRINYIARDGGNRYTGAFYANFANDAMQGNNITPELQANGFAFPDSVKLNFDVNPGFGGPIVRDRLWFFVAGRTKGEDLYAANIYDNLNANNPSAWTYVPDRSSRPLNSNRTKDAQVRVTWQAAQRHKVGFLMRLADNCACPTAVGPTRSPEAANNRSWPRERQWMGDYSAPLTNRIFIEAGTLYYQGSAGALPNDDLDPRMIGVTEQSTGLLYRTADPGYRVRYYNLLHSRAVMSYVPGAHALRAGINRTAGFNRFDQFANQPVTYRFNLGVPNRITQIAYPYVYQVDVDNDMGLFASDKWTIRRFTANLGVRYHFLGTSSPAQTIGPTPLTPSRNLSFPEAPGLSWKDVTPHLGAAYDLFGNGRTAVKVSLNKYMDAVSYDALPADLAPVRGVVTTANRSWADTNLNFVPDCDLLNPLAQDTRGQGGDTCGALDNTNFGTPVRGVTVDPDVVEGWGKRTYDWEFSAGVQHALSSNLSVSVDYFRRWFGNFVVTDNLAVAPADFDPFSITAPADPGLPGGGGYPVNGLYDLNPRKFGVPADNFQTFADNFGKQIEHWNGVDVTVDARLRGGIRVGGGMSTGKTTTDNCEVVTKLDNPSPLYCHNETPFLTQVKFLGSYTLPKIDVLVAATYQGRDMTTILANYNAPNAAIIPSLGRPLSGGAANYTVNLVDPNSLYGDRLNQIDFRVGKIVRFGSTRSVFNVDIFNALNASTVLSYNNNFAVWQRPVTVLQPRFVKLSVQLDF